LPATNKHSLIILPSSKGCFFFFFCFFFFLAFAELQDGHSLYKVLSCIFMGSPSNLFLCIPNKECAHVAYMLKVQSGISYLHLM